MACERILQAQSRIRKAINPCGATAISYTRIEYEVDIFQIARAFHEVAADHADTAESYDPVVLAKAGGFDIAERHRCRQVIQPHVLFSASGARRDNSTPPPPKPRGGLAALAGESSNPIRVRRGSGHTPSVQERNRRCCAGRSLQGRARRRSCSAQDQDSARASAVIVRPAGADPSRMLETIRGETNASGSSSRMCRSAFPFAPGKHGQAANPAVDQLVDPAASLRNRHQQALATRRCHRRIVRGHMDDAFDSGRQRTRPGNGNRGDVGHAER